MFLQPVLILSHFEKIIVFLNLLNFTLAFRAITINEILFCPEPFIRCAIPAFVTIFINFFAVIELLQNVTYKSLVPLLSGANKIIIRNVKPRPKLFESFMKLVNVLLWFNTKIPCCLKDFLSMFIRAR